MRFSSPQHALRWAFEINNTPIVLTTTQPLSGGSTPHEHHAQAALILRLCEQALPALHMAYIRVQFGREAAGFEILVHHLAANFGTTVHSRRSIEQIIRAYCGEKIGLREIRKSMSCGMLKAVSYRNQAYDLLDAIHLQVMEQLRREMDKKGLLNRVAVIA